MKKRIAALFCVLLCVFTLTACSSSDDSQVKEDVSAKCVAEAAEVVSNIVSLDEEQLRDQLAVYSDGGSAPDAGMYSGLEAWEDTKSDLGAFDSISEGTVKFDSKNKIYITNLKASFSDRNAQIVVTYNKNLEISSIAINPDYSFGEKMEKAALNTLMGLAVVFVMLVLISLIIFCFNFIHAAEEKAKAKAKAEAPAPAPIQAAAPAVEEEEPEDDLELIAVITAAIAASEGTSPDGLVVRSIKRARKTSNWKNA